MQTRVKTFGINNVHFVVSRVKLKGIIKLLARLIVKQPSSISQNSNCDKMLQAIELYFDHGRWYHQPGSNSTTQ